MFRVLSDIHLDSGSVRIIPITRNTTKQDPFGIYVGFRSVRIRFYRIGFGSDFRVRFICPALGIVLLPRNILYGERTSTTLQPFTSNPILIILSLSWLRWMLHPRVSCKTNHHFKIKNFQTIEYPKSWTFS